MFKSISSCARSIVRNVVRTKLENIEDDPHAKAFFTVLEDGTEVTFDEFNELVEQQMADLNASDPQKASKPRISIPVWDPLHNSD